MKTPESTNQESLAKAKETKSTAIINAVLIGFLIGIIIYSVAKNTWGFFTLLPLYMVYKLANQPENKEQN